MSPKCILVLLLALVFASASIADEYPRPTHEKPPQEKPPHENPPYEKPPHDNPPQEKPPHENPPYGKPPRKLLPEELSLQEQEKAQVNGHKPPIQKKQPPKQKPPTSFENELPEGRNPIVPYKPKPPTPMGRKKPPHGPGHPPVVEEDAYKPPHKPPHKPPTAN